MLKKFEGDVTAAPREGANIHGLFLEGARWDLPLGALANSDSKELCAPMPILYVKALAVEKREQKNVFDCPVYRTPARGPTYSFTAQLRTADPPSKWVLAGVALLMSRE